MNGSGALGNGEGLRVWGVSHRYGTGPVVLSDIDLTVTPGESVALMGPSGSGKTTLLSIIGLLTQPTEGSVLVDGAVIPPRRRARARAELFSWVFQTVNVLGPRTALDNASLGLVASGVPRSTADAEGLRALETVGLASRAGDRVVDLSGGELQRVCIARALASRTRFVLADEPTGQLDRSTSDRVLEALWETATDKTSLIVASHDETVAARCDRVVTIVDGALLGHT